MMSVQCLQCGREHFSRGPLNTCPVCGGNVQLLHASVFDANGIRMNQLHAALQIVNAAEERAWERHTEVCRMPHASDKEKSDAGAEARHYTVLSGQLMTMIADERDIQQLLADIFTSAASRADA